MAGLPKAELHMHIEGSIEPELFLRLARRNGVAIRWQTQEELRAAYNFTDLQDFLTLYYDGCRVPTPTGCSTRRCSWGCRGIPAAACRWPR
jgi:adenosine deaminase